MSERERELKDLKDQFREDFPVGPLIGKCCTMDQVQFTYLLHFLHLPLCIKKNLLVPRKLKMKRYSQGKAVINFLDSILDKSLRSTVALLAARGRGKSAALGLAIAGAIAAG